MEIFRKRLPADENVIFKFCTKIHSRTRVAKSPNVYLIDFYWVKCKIILQVLTKLYLNLIAYFKKHAPPPILFCVSFKTQGYCITEGLQRWTPRPGSPTYATR